MSANDGGPAFPCPDDYTQEGKPVYGPKNLQGMSLRDWFAGMALQGWLASFGPDAAHPVRNESQGDVALQAYEMADAMLAARERKDNA